MDGSMPRSARPQLLTANERAALQERRLNGATRQRLAALLDPFAEVFLRHTLCGSRDHDRRSAQYSTFRVCGQMMLDLECTYWAFTWERLLAWKAKALEQGGDRAPSWRHDWETCWTRVTSTLFFLGILPYSEEIHRTYHRELAEKWLGPARAREIEASFIAAAKAMGYRYERQLRKNAVSVLLTVLTATGKSDLAQVTRADLEQWQAQTSRSPRVARASVTCIQHVLMAMGYLEGNARTQDGTGPPFTWGATRPYVAATFERFLVDLGTVLQPATVAAYKVALRRFGDWLGTYDPALTSVAEVRRRHIEVYKQAVMQMRCGDHTSVGAAFKTMNFGEPLSQAQRVRAISCVRSFFERIDALEYPERPGRALFVRGDVARIDEQLPRYIPEDDWRQLVATVEQLTPERLAAHRFQPPAERVRVVLALLLECGLRAGELCRLDTSCLVEARDVQTGQKTHWLRVPVGKLHNDRMIPVRPHVVDAVDTWMRARAAAVPL